MEKPRRILCPARHVIKNARKWSFKTLLSAPYWSIFVNQPSGISDSFNITQDGLTVFVTMSKTRRRNHMHTHIYVYIYI